MGIFEKSIPKYIINPIDEQVTVAPQDVYVDDIFDPVLNANVRNAMRQKYGDGLYGIVGGYSELLNNVWNGDGGLFGKGMGLLSAFGRSMEKADDIVLGTLTESVEGLSGQGFDNPLKNIFVNDEDYTGKRLLASTANIFRDFAGGTTVTEDDFGTAWNIPALGIELGTDVGILGSGLSRKLAPKAREFTSKELFQNLGKSDVKTTVGEIGQLMSNYDDLMARVAIDITAPGLRPAFKKLGNRLAQYVRTHAPMPFADVDILKRDPEVRRAAKEYYDNEPSSKLLNNVIQTAESIPTSKVEFSTQVADSPDTLIQEVVGDEALQNYKYVQNLLNSDAYAKINTEYQDLVSKYASEISSAEDEVNTSLMSDFNSFLERIATSGIPLPQIGIDQTSKEIVDLIDRPSIEFLKSMHASGTTYDDLLNIKNKYEDEWLRNPDSSLAKSRLHSYEEAVSKAHEAQESLNEIRQIIKNNVNENTVNKTYIDEVFEKLETDQSLLDAVQTMEWSTNQATNDYVERVLSNPTYKDSLWYASANSKYTVSPSRFSKLKSYGAKGTSAAHSLLDSARYAFKSPEHVRFSSAEELDRFIDSDRFLIAFSEYFPIYAKRLKNKGVAKNSAEYFKELYAKLEEFKSLVKEVYYPTSTDVNKYTKSLEKLSTFLDEAKTLRPGVSLGATPNEISFLEDLYNAFDDIDQIYIQKLRGEPLHAKGSKILQTEDAFSDYFTSNSIVEYIQSVLHQIAPYVKTSSELQYLTEPVLKYVQVKPSNRIGKVDEIRKYLSNITGIAEDKLPHHLIAEELQKNSLTVSKESLDKVHKFKTEFLPKFVEYVKKGGNPFKNKPKNISWNEHNEIRRLLGLSDKYSSVTPYEFGYANRMMLNSIYNTKNNRWLFDPKSTHSIDIALEDAAMRAEISQDLFDIPKLDLKDDFTDIANRYRKEPATAKNASEEIEAVKSAIDNGTPEAVAKQAYEPFSDAEAAVDKIIEDTASDIDSYIKQGGTPESAKTIFGERKWNLYEQIQKARAVPGQNAFASERATLRTKVAEALAKAFEAVTGKARPEDFKRFYRLRASLAGDIVKGSDFWTTFRRSGILIAPYVKGSEMVKSTSDTLTRNAQKINKLVGKDVVEVITYNLDNGNVAVVMRWNGNKNTAKLVKNAQKKLDSAVFEDTVFTKAAKLTAEDQAFLNTPAMRELSDLMDRLQAQAADQAKYLGFNFDNTSPYTKHAMRHDPETAMWLSNNIYTNMKSEDYDTLSSLISDLDGYRQIDKGVFGTSLQERRFRGDYWLIDNKHHPLFEYSPDKVFNSTLGDGIFANLQYQSFVDLFINDNFKIKEWFKTPEELKEVLYAKLPNGKMSGNLQNLELVSFKLDANGRISRLVTYDKLSDDGLRKALADENTILVPANAVAHMNNILRKDIRMNNKFWTFINKHFTIPFKFGILSNPGFLVGNVSDSTLKLATTMSEKYGTTLFEEAANVAECINQVIRLKNVYTNEVFADWLKTVDEYGIKIAPEARVPDIVAMSPKYKDMLLQYLDGTLTVKLPDPATGKLVDTPVLHGLEKSQVDQARTYMMLQGMQMSSSKLREFADLAGLTHTSDFEVPYNLFDRVTQGKGKYRWNKPSTWGLFMNNPVMKSFTDASGAWEDIIRTASILDDLQHNKYTYEQMSEFSKAARPDVGAARRQFDVHLEEAKNTMFNAQFDYERQGDFLSGVGTAIPFPVFFLKNFAYWMELFMSNPQYVDNAIDVQEGLWSGYNEDDDKFMTEAKGRGAVPVGGKALPDWFKGVYKPSPLQSMFGAFNLLNSPIDNLTYRVNPLISGATTAVTNALPDNELTTLLQDPESVKYRPYSTNIYERNIKLNNEKFSPVEYTLHRMNPYDRVMNSYLRIPEKVEKDEFQMSDVLPSVFQPMF